MKILFPIVVFSLLSWQPSIAGVTDELEEARGLWIEAYNSRSNELQSFYTDRSGLFSEDHFFFDKEKITEHLLQSTTTIHSAEVIKTFKISGKRYFQSGTYKAGDSGDITIHFSTIWLKNSRSKDQPRWLQAHDVMYVQEGEYPDSDTLDTARKQWNKLATKRSASRMINALYTEDAIYIHKREVHSGRPAIIKEYGTYIDGGYAVRLSPKRSVVVQPDLAIDIGKYTAQGGTGGYYVQVWKQQPDQSWRVIFEVD